MLFDIGTRAKAAARVLAGCSEEEKNDALYAMASALEEDMGLILDENEKDVREGKRSGLTDALIDRLTLTEDRIRSMAAGMRAAAALPDPVGRTLSEKTLPNGLFLRKISVPIGVIAVIFEARPNVTADSAALCLKSGNAAILRGGREAIRSNIAIADSMRRALEKTDVPADSVQLITDTSRDSANELMRANKFVDLLIPRGGAGLIRAVVENATVPVIETGAGTCHVYVDKDANAEMAANIIYNAKTSRPSVCNAAECMLIHRDVAEKALPVIAERLQEKDVEIRGDVEVCAILDCAVPASEDDWGREYGDYIIAARVVDSLSEAVEHIYKYGTGHSECIVTESAAAAEEFMRRVDAAAVYHNASTRFTDGGEFGMGAEIGISTQKLHARGPLGLEELTSMKYLVFGKGQAR